MQYLFMRENEDDSYCMLNVNYAFCQTFFLSVTEYNGH